MGRGDASSESGVVGWAASDPKNPIGWPGADAETPMDPSQLLALRTALTSNVALIQGPPGTGKTFTGLQVCARLQT